MLKRKKEIAILLLLALLLIVVVLLDTRSKADTTEQSIHNRTGTTTSSRDEHSGDNSDASRTEAIGPALNAPDRNNESNASSEQAVIENADALAESEQLEPPVVSIEQESQPTTIDSGAQST
jgi:hypothetical protein